MAAKVATKSEILNSIATKTELSRKQVASVFDALSDEIKNNVGKKGPGVFAVPGLMKITVINKPAPRPAKASIPSRRKNRCSRPSPLVR